MVRYLSVLDLSFLNFSSILWKPIVSFYVKIEMSFSSERTLSETGRPCLVGAVVGASVTTSAGASMHPLQRPFTDTFPTSEFTSDYVVEFPPTSSTDYSVLWSIRSSGKGSEEKSRTESEISKVGARVMMGC